MNKCAVSFNATHLFVLKVRNVMSSQRVQFVKRIVCWWQNVQFCGYSLESAKQDETAQKHLKMVLCCCSPKKMFVSLRNLSRKNCHHFLGEQIINKWLGFGVSFENWGWKGYIHSFIQSPSTHTNLLLGTWLSRTECSFNFLETVTKALEMVFFTLFENLMQTRQLKKKEMCSAVWTSGHMTECLHDSGNEDLLTLRLSWATLWLSDCHLHDCYGRKWPFGM